jgi:ArsR family transcriptional regulator
MLQAAKRRLKEPNNIELRRGELTSMPMENGELSMALMVLVLPYADQPQKVLAEAARATREGGRLVIIDMQSHQRAEYRDDLGHTWLGFTRDQIDDWLSLSGWQMQRYVELPPDPEAKGPGLFAITASKVKNAEPMINELSERTEMTQSS